MEQSCLFGHLTSGDVVLADKAFVIQDLKFSIPPFLNNGSFTESEGRATKDTATF